MNMRATVRRRTLNNTDNLATTECPERVLWIFHPDESSGYFTVIDCERLVELRDGAAPEDEAEQMLVDNPEWLRIYLEHVIGEWPITVTVGEPLPEWNESWLEGVEAQPEKQLELPDRSESTTVGLLGPAWLRGSKRSS